METSPRIRLVSAFTAAHDLRCADGSKHAIFDDDRRLSHDVESAARGRFPAFERQPSKDHAAAVARHLEHLCVPPCSDDRARPSRFADHRNRADERRQLDGILAGLEHEDGRLDAALAKNTRELCGSSRAEAERRHGHRGMLNRPMREDPFGDLSACAAVALILSAREAMAPRSARRLLDQRAAQKVHGVRRNLGHVGGSEAERSRPQPPYALDRDPVGLTERVVPVVAASRRRGAVAPLRAFP